LSSRLAAPDDLLRTYYYHCMPYQSNPPTKDEAERFGSMQRFCSRLTRLDRFQVRLGQLAYRGDNAQGERIFIQKRVDILLGVDLVLLSARHAIERAGLLVGDSDFLPAVHAAKNEGVLVHLYHGGPKNPPHHDLWEAADDRTQLDQAFVNSILRA